MAQDVKCQPQCQNEQRNFTQSISIALGAPVSREQDRLQYSLKHTVAYSRFTQFNRQWIPDGRTPTEKVRRPSVLCRYRGTIKRWRCRLADRRCRLATSAIGVQQLTRCTTWCFVLQTVTPMDHDSQLVLHAFKNVEPVELVVNQRWHIWQQWASKG